jgi:hypothetical protein
MNKFLVLAVIATAIDFGGFLLVMNVDSKIALGVVLMFMGNQMMRDVRAAKAQEKK